MQKFDQFGTFSNNKKKADILAEKFCNPMALSEAKSLLNQDEVSEEAFLGAQGVLLLNGLL